MDLLTELAILVLAAFVGFEVISKVPNTLHTPLMSGTNAIHGIVVLGGLLLIGPADGFLESVLLVIAIAFGTINVIGGFLVTDRMLGMFKGKKPDPVVEAHRGDQAAAVSRTDVIQILYIVAFSMFIIGLHMLRGPRTAVRGNQVAAVGMAIAVFATLLYPGVGDWVLIVVGVAIGTAIGIPSARSVKMTAMPQMVALFNGVGGGAVALISFVEFRESGGDLELEALIPILFAAIIGSISFWGSIIAFLKLQETLKRSIKVPREVNAGLLLLAVALAVVIAAGSDSQLLFFLILLSAGLLGVLAVVPIGGADMPVVISTLNAFTGLSRRRRRHRARQHRADRGRHARRRLRLDPHQADGRRDEPLDRQRLLRRRRRGRPHARGRDRRHGALHERRRRRDPALLRAPGRRRARLRHGGRAGPARGRGPRRRSSRSAASRCSTRSTRSRAACPAT